VQLAIRVAEADVVAIDQREAADSAPCQRLAPPRADPADTHDAHVRRRQARGTADAIEAIDAAKTFVDGGLVHAGAEVSTERTGAYFSAASAFRRRKMAPAS